MERILSPQQESFLSYYTNPNSDTFGNAKRSALKAKYSEEYANNITVQMPEWLSENLGRFKMLSKAEKVLDRTLDYDPVDENGKMDSSLLRTQTDVAKFVAGTVGKQIYSTKNDLNVVVEKRVISIDE